MSNDFFVTKKIKEYIYLDEKNKKWTIPEGIFKKKINPLKIHSYEDITEFELLEDGNSISKGGIGRAIIGGALFGGVGAIVGGVTGHRHKSTCSKLQIKITLKDLNKPLEYITFISGGNVRKDGLSYRSCFKYSQEIMSILQIISSSNHKTKTTENNEISKYDELLKYKKLLDMNAITKAEFEAKKKEFLNL